MIDDRSSVGKTYIERVRLLVAHLDLSGVMFDWEPGIAIEISIGVLGM